MNMNLRKPIYKNLYQFSQYIPQIDTTIHTYLLASNPAIMFASGTIRQAEQILPQVKSILNETGCKIPLKYIFVSHIESDECGGISVFEREYPDVTIICSSFAAHEFMDYGYSGQFIAGKSDSNLADGDLNLRFINYPSETHLIDGIICLEQNSGILYSSDILFEFGNGIGKVEKGRWYSKVHAIDQNSIPDSTRLAEFKGDLLSIAPKFAAVGHGYCIEFEYD